MLLRLSLRSDDNEIKYNTKKGKSKTKQNKQHRDHCGGNLFLELTRAVSYKEGKLLILLPNALITCFFTMDNADKRFLKHGARGHINLL